MLKTQLDPEKSGGDQLECIVREEPKLALEGKRAYYSSVVPRTPSEDTTFDEIKADHELAQLLKQNMLYVLKSVIFIDSLLIGYFKDFLSSGRPVLLSSGVRSSTLDEWQRRATSEIIEPQVPWCLRWDLLWANKNC